jgi:hypothetical protein
MQYKLRDNLGLLDARKCNMDLGASLSLDPKDLRGGCVIELPQPAANYLSKKYCALLEPATAVKGESKKPELTGPAK